jgi:hypothetical protein
MPKSLDLPERIVRALLADLQARSGLGDEWEQIDQPIQREIRVKWIRLVSDELYKDSKEVDNAPNSRS